ncbi:MAG: hypothetical protein ACPIOQ_10905, partial [Promethearchaeia archaeon]
MRAAPGHRQPWESEQPAGRPDAPRAAGLSSSQPRLNEATEALSGLSAAEWARAAQTLRAALEAESEGRADGGAAARGVGAASCRAEVQEELLRAARGAEERGSGRAAAAQQQGLGRAQSQHDQSLPADAEQRQRHARLLAQRGQQRA